MPNFIVRMLREDEIDEALRLVKVVFDEFEATDYSSEGIGEFNRFIEYDSIIRDVRRKFLKFFGSFDNKNLVGVLAVRENRHISLLFVNKKYHRRGVAKGLVNEVIKYCIKENMSLENITVNSSTFAVDSYKAMGFKQMSTEQVVNGIRFVPMKYYI